MTNQSRSDQLSDRVHVGFWLTVSYAFFCYVFAGSTFHHSPEPRQLLFHIVKYFSSPFWWNFSAQFLGRDEAQAHKTGRKRISFSLHLHSSDLSIVVACAKYFCRLFFLSHIRRKLSWWLNMNEPRYEMWMSERIVEMYATPFVALGTWKGAGERSEPATPFGRLIARWKFADDGSKNFEVLINFEQFFSCSCHTGRGK